MIVCVLIPRFALLAAAGDRELLLRPAALAPEPGREQVIGEVSGAAEAFGVRPGMLLGEALSRCPGLVLVPPDPDRVASAWESLLGRLEGIGAAVESARPGEAFFEADGLRDLWGGHLEGVIARARRALPGRPGARVDDRPRRGGQGVPRPSPGGAASRSRRRRAAGGARAARH